MEKKQILVISDGICGNYKQSQAIVRIVQERFPAEVVWVNVRLRRRYRDLLRFFLNHTPHVPSPKWLRMFYNIASDLPSRPDLIVSRGQRTKFMSAWLAAHYRCPNIFIGPMKGLDHRYFTRIVSSRLGDLGEGQYIKSAPATEIDPDLAAEAASAFLKATGLPERRRWTLVLGGDTYGYSYTKADWEELCRAAYTLSKVHDLRWLVTTSRRTSPEAEGIFASATMKACADDVLIYNHDRRPLFNAFLGCAELIVCTEDSRLMLTESVASGRPVLSVRPPQSGPNDRPRAELRRFEAAGHIQRLTIRELGTAPVQEFVDQYQPPAEAVMQPLRAAINELLSTLSWAA